jgi:hypothetical protein
VISEQAIADAIAQFWLGRTSGTQSAKHDKALLELVAADLKELGWDTHIAGYANDPRAVVGGHFRPAKSWDIVCRTPDGTPRILVEFKSQVDSYGNNENNRYEEALGSGLDARARFGAQLALGFFLVFCEEEATMRKTRNRAEGLDPVFADSSHVQRREVFGQRIVAFRLNDMPFYDASAVLLVRRDGTFRYPADPDLDVRTFASRLSRAASRLAP